MAGYIYDHSNTMWNEYDSYEMHSQILGLNLSISACDQQTDFLEGDFIPSEGTNQTYFTINKSEFD